MVSVVSEQGDELAHQGGSHRQSWTISDIAHRCSVSRSTVRRYLADGKFPNAIQRPDKSWSVPVGDLLAAGLRPGGQGVAQGVATELAQGGQRASSPELATQDDELQRRVDELAHLLAMARVELAGERAQRSALEANLSDLRTALRMLEAAPTSAPTSGLPETVPTSSTSAPTSDAAAPTSPVTTSADPAPTPTSGRRWRLWGRR